MKYSCEQKAIGLTTISTGSSRGHPLKILISNDDGYRADGLQHLVAALKSVAKLTVVAPERNRSGASNSLTLDIPLRVAKYDEDMYYINGTPTDCVHMAISGLFEQEHDMVVSGINDGANLGDDTLYSGTVAAAVEGRFLGLPAIAVSLVNNGGNHFAAAGRVAAELVLRLQRAPLGAATILNVNVPDLPYEQIKGVLVTRLGFRHRSEPVIRSLDPKGKEVFWVGPAGAEQDAGPGTDFHAIANGYVSVTPLQTDLTRHSMLDDLRDWIAGKA